MSLQLTLKSKKKPINDLITKLTIKKIDDKLTIKRKSNVISFTERIKTMPEIVLNKILNYCGKGELANLYDIDQTLRNIIRGKNEKRMVRHIKSCNIYENQWNAAEKICDYFLKGYRYVLLTAQPQSGKTGTCQAVCYLVRQLKEKLNITNYWFLCGMNDNGLKKQQTLEFNGLIEKKHVLFSKDMQMYKGSEDASYFENSLIILDESHYAQTGHTLNKHSMVHQFLTNHVGISLDGIEDKNKGKNLWFLSVSATPMSELVHFLRPLIRNNEAGEPIEIEQPKAQVRLEPASTYYGFKRMMELNKIHKSFNLGVVDERQQFVDILTTHYEKQKTQKQYKYAVIRFSNTGHGEEWRQALQLLINFPISYIHFHSKFMYMNDINKIISKPPDKFTIIEVYHSLRAGIQMNTENICLVHDSFRANTDVTAQGLSGRACGYSKEKHGVEVYCYKERIEKYIKLVEENFDPRYVPGNCYNVKHGYSENLGEKFKSNIPMGGKLNDEMIERIIKLKNENKQYGVKFEKDGYLKEIRELEFVDKTLWDKSKFVGITIMDEKNKEKSESKTNTWIKFWDPAFKAMIDKRPGSYFRHTELPEDINHFTYIYINVKKDHPEYGWILITSKERYDENNINSYITTTGKEQFHPKNNMERTQAPEKITLIKKEPKKFKFNNNKFMQLMKQKTLNIKIEYKEN